MLENDKKGLNNVSKYIKNLHGTDTALVTQYFFDDNTKNVYITYTHYGVKENIFDIAISYEKYNRTLNIMDRTKKLNKICSHLKM